MNDIPQGLSCKNCGQPITKDTRHEFVGFPDDFYHRASSCLPKMIERVEASPVIHILHHGFPLCVFNHEVPAKWPTGHKWTSNVWEATCRPCQTHAWSKEGRRHVRLEDPGITPEEWNRKVGDWLNEP